VRELPDGWLDVDLGDISSFEMGQAPPGSASNFEGVGTIFVKAGEFGTLFPVIREWTIDPKRFAKEGDVLICVVGATVGKLNLAIDCAIGRSVAAIRPLPGIQQRCIYYQLLRKVDEIRAGSSGSAQGVISSVDLSRIQMRLPPAKEQTRIVTKLEELLSALDAGVAELKAAQKKLAHYRQSLLKAAVSGELTAAWREKNPPKETGQQLLQRILRERRGRWETAQTLKFQAQGKAPPKGWKEKYVEPVQPEVGKLPTLPAGWIWSSMDSLLVNIEAGASFKCEERPPNPEEIGVVKVSAVSWGEFNEQESKTCHDLQRIDSSLLVQPGDFLFSRANTIELVGACVIAKSVNLRVMLSDKILRFLFASDSLKPWVRTFLRSEFGRQQIESLASGNQESMRNIGQGRIREILIPIPPSDELVAIENMLDTQMNGVAKQAAWIEQSLKQSTAQRKNILQAAFSGQLVPQNPADEPASALLARIRAAREAMSKVAKPGRSFKAAANEPTGTKRGRPAKSKL
jgi:type I restriction enzyme, S subunit